MNEKAESDKNAASSTFGNGKDNTAKKKMIPAYVDRETFAKFTAINKKQGLSNNGILNMLIFQHVRQHNDVLQFWQ